MEMKTKHSVPICVIAILFLNYFGVNGQIGMAINSTGAIANPSAMLDVASNSQGILVPRMLSGQRAAISSPATGLLVYQIDGTEGFYFNSCTPTAPNWVMLGLAVANTSGNILSGLKVVNNPVTPNTKTDITINATGTITNDATILGANGLDAGSLAANTWYYFYLISNGTIVTLSSTSATSPTLPAGYTKVAYIGSRLTDGTSHFYRINQFGNRCRYVVGSNPTGVPALATGSTSGWSSVNTVGTCSPVASAIYITAIAGNVWSYVTTAVAPNTTYDYPNTNNGLPPPPIKLQTSSYGPGGNVSADIYFETANTIYYYGSSYTSGIFCSGWTENL